MQKLCFWIANSFNCFDWILRTQKSPTCWVKIQLFASNRPNEAPTVLKRVHPEINSFERNKQTTRTEIKAPYLPSNCSGTAKRKFKQNLIVFSCGPDGAAPGRSGERWWDLQTPQEIALTRDTWHSNSTSSAYYSPKQKFWSVQKGDPFRQELIHCSTRCGIPGMTYKKTLCQSFAECDPSAAARPFIIPLRSLATTWARPPHINHSRSLMTRCKSQKKLWNLQQWSVSSRIMPT